MSLSFVSKSIQTVKDDGEFEEKEVENPTETTGSASLRASSGLFDQLRKNKEQEEAEREEFQRSITRGTLALDEDDAAHLDYLESLAKKRRSEMQTETKLALEDFRAAQSVLSNQKKSETGRVTGEVMSLETSLDNRKQMPAVVVKKRKRRDTGEETDKPSASNGSKLGAAPDATTSNPGKPVCISKGSISSLLGEYNSSSEDES